MSLQSVPMFRLLVLFVLGIGIQCYYPLPLDNASYVYGLLLLVLAILAIYKCATLKSAQSVGALIMLLLVMLGYGRSNEYNQLEPIPTFGNDCFIKVLVLDRSGRYDRQRLIVKVLDEYTKAGKKNLSGRKLLLRLAAFDSSDLMIPGLQILLRTKVKPIPPPEAPFLFNQQTYWRNKGIFEQAWVGEEDLIWIGEHTIFNWRKYLWKVQNGGVKILSNHLDTTKLGVASALLLGNKQFLDFELKQAYINSGTIHILAVSGLHVGFVVLILNGLFRAIGKLYAVPVVIEVFIILTILWGYAMITGGSPSVCRSVLMFSCWKIGVAFKKGHNGSNGVLASAFILLWIDPQLIWDIGFQLSYAAVGGILFFFPHISQLFHFKYSLIKYCWDLCAISIAAQIVTLPISLFYFQQFPVFFAIGSLVVIPLAALILYAGFGLFLCNEWAFMATKISAIIDGAIGMINTSVRAIEQLPLSLIKVADFQLIELVMYYCVLGIIYYWLSTRTPQSRNLSLILAICLLLIRSLLCFPKQKKETVAIYPIRKGIIIHVISKGSSLIFTNTKLPEKKLNYLRSGIDQQNDLASFRTTFIPPTMTQLTTNNFDLYFLQNHCPNLDISKDRQVVLLLFKYSKVLQEYIASNVGKGTIIIDMTNNSAFQKVDLPGRCYQHLSLGEYFIR